jgi:hypothetical protein
MGGNAVLGTDYTLSGTPGEVTVQAGQSSGTVVLTHTKMRNGRRNATMNLNSCTPDCTITSNRQDQSATVSLR